MPRTGKGGKREGASQTSYANRTDLNDRGPQPITAAPGQAYGERQMQEDAQRAVPMAGIDVPAPQPQAAPAQPQQLIPAPGEYLFDHPTQRPEEPLLAGVHPVYGIPSQEMTNRPHAALATALESASMSPEATPLVQHLAEIVRGSLS